MMYEKGPEAPAHGLTVEYALRFGRSALNCMQFCSQVMHDIGTLARTRDLEQIPAIEAPQQR